MVSMDALRSSSFRSSAPPGAAPRAPEPPAPQPVDRVHLAPAAPDAPETVDPLPLWRRSVLVAALAASTLTGVAGQAMAAGVGPEGPRASAVAVLADVHAAPSKLQVTVLPERLPRLDLVRQVESRSSDADPFADAKVPYSPVGIHLGDGLVQDTNGNLFLVPTMTAGWDLAVQDFTHVDLGKGDASVARFGSTVHYNESSTRRHVIFERGDGAEVLSTRGRTALSRDEAGNVKARGPDGQSWELLKTSDGYRVLPGHGPALAVQLNPDGVQVRRAGRLVGDSQVSPGGLQVRGQDGRAELTRSEGGVLVEIDGHQGWRDGRIVHDGRLFLGNRDSQRIEVDPPQVVGEARARYQQVLASLDSVEPGWAEKHPVVASVLEYASANPRLLAREGDLGGFLQGGTALATAGGALQSGVALATGAKALSLAESAKALGAAALSAKAAAGAAAQAGNMAQAAALAKEAQALAGQARELGGRAMDLGKSAQNTAHVARIMLGVAGALQIVDGGMGVHGGQKDQSVVEGAIAVTQAQMDDLKAHLSGPELERAMEDYSKTMRVLDYLKKEADKDVTVGGLKVGFGTLLLVSALLGPEAPMALTVLGIAGTAGTTIYEHWDEVHGFLTGEKQEVPRFVDLFPDSDQVRIDLGNPVK